MYPRLLELPQRSFFLFGPRGTGKTTWLRRHLAAALWFDLLRTQTFLDLTRTPDRFRQQVEARPRGSWIVVDEVQRLPPLLHELHALMSEHGRAYRFAMSGSSIIRPIIPNASDDGEVGIAGWTTVFSWSRPGGRY